MTWEEIGQGWTAHFEREFPKPENYHKKSTARLWAILRHANDLIRLYTADMKRDKSDCIPVFIAAWKRHRGYARKELRRRAVQGKVVA